MRIFLQELTRKRFRVMQHTAIIIIRKNVPSKLDLNNSTDLHKQKNIVIYPINVLIIKILITQLIYQIIKIHIYHYIFIFPKCYYI